MNRIDIPAGGLPPRPAMRGRYLIRSSTSWACVAALDKALSLVPVRHPRPLARYDRILVANWSHLGDVVLTLPALAALRKHYPDAQIDMITGSWAKSAAEGSRLINKVHIIDHWLLNRNDINKAKKWIHTKRAALEQMREQKYQLGIDFYPFFPPAHPLFWRVGIPRRVAFDSAGFGPLLTDAVSWLDTDRPISDYGRDLLDKVLLSSVSPQDFAFTYPLSETVLLPPALTANTYTVVHPGAGTRFKDWGESNWHSLIGLLRQQERRLVITGSGKWEIELAERLEKGGAINLVGKLDWNGFVKVIANASALICPDTVAGHLAAMFKIPTVVISTGTNNSAQWGPNNPSARVLVKITPCAPCNRPGCPAMACIRDITPVDVLNALETLHA